MQFGAMRGPATTSGLAIAGFVTSFFCGLVGLTLCVIALGKIKESNGRLTGTGLATAGILISILAFLIAIAVTSGR
jgi:hypothetical protein